MTKRKTKLPKGWEPQYIETPLKVFYGRKDKVVYPHFLIFLIGGAFIAALVLL